MKNQMSKLQEIENKFKLSSDDVIYLMELSKEERTKMDSLNETYLTPSIERKIISAHWRDFINHPYFFLFMVMLFLTVSVSSLFMVGIGIILIILYPLTEVKWDVLYKIGLDVGTDVVFKNGKFFTKSYLIADKILDKKYYSLMTSQSIKRKGG